MINNEFHVIGVCTSNPTNIGNKKFICYSMRIEVEKYKGGVFTLEAIIYSTNHAIDVNQEYIGKQVALNGFVDSFIQDSGEVRLKLVAQNILILNKNPKYQPKIKSAEKGEAVNVGTPDVDDDLPF